MITIKQQKIGGILLRLVAKPHKKYSNMVPCYYFVVEADDIPDLVCNRHLPYLERDSGRAIVRSEVPRRGAERWSEVVTGSWLCCSQELVQLKRQAARPWVHHAALGGHRGDAADKRMTQ